MICLFQPPVPAGHPQPAPQPHYPPQQQPPVMTGPVMLNTEQLAKLRSELDIVQGNVKVFGEMLTEMTPGQENREDLELLQVEITVPEKNKNYNCKIW